MDGPDWRLLDVALFTLFLAFVFVAVPLTAARVRPVFGVGVLAVELTVVAVYELGLASSYKRALRRLWTGDYRDEWQRDE